MKLKAKDTNGDPCLVYFSDEDVQQMKLSSDKTELLIHFNWYEITEPIDLDEYEHYIETKNDEPYEFELDD